MRRVFIFGVVLVLGTAPTAVAQYTDSDQLAKVGAVVVESPNLTFRARDVTCRPNANSLADEVELVLRSAGIAVVSEREALALSSELPRPHWFQISLLGDSVTMLSATRCAVPYRVLLYRYEVPIEGSVGRMIAFENFGIWTGGTQYVAQGLRDLVRNETVALANEILKARQSQ